MKIIEKIKNKIRSYAIEQICQVISKEERLMQTNLSTFALHQKVFPQFKEKYLGRDVVVVGTGPSLQEFKPIEDCIYMGVNKAFLYDKIRFDYLFAQDYYSVKSVMSQMNAYRKEECIKFYGLLYEYLANKRDGEDFVIPESDVIAAHAYRYRCDFSEVNRRKSRFSYDISSMPLAVAESTIFSALQFALWTAPKTIYIVGCDCKDVGHFYDSDTLEVLSKTRPVDMSIFSKIHEEWLDFKRFANVYYPSIRIVSVNPVGLKGLFEDWVQ